MLFVIVAVIVFLMIAYGTGGDAGASVENPLEKSSSALGCVLLVALSLVLILFAMSR